MLIITSDDFGMSRSVNQAIREGVEAGIITSTNVMTGMELFKEIIGLKKEFPKLSVGLHWNLCIGKPVSNISTVPTLVDSNGEFWSLPIFKQKFKKRLIKIDEIEIELKAQYDKFVEYCGEPEYWNTHQNIHVNFKLFDIFLNMAVSLKINKMRNNLKLIIPSQGPRTIKLVKILFEPIKKSILRTWIKKANAMGVSSPQGILIFMRDEDKFDFRYICKHISTKKNFIGELVIHPAVCDDSKYFGTLTNQRINEYELFRNPELKKIAAELNVEICDFQKI